jgi:hypothetical protein
MATLTPGYTFTSGEVVTPAKLNSAASPTLVPATVTNADISPTAAIAGSKLADAYVATAKLADASVTTAKLADASVATAKLADASVATAKLADASVTTAKIADGSITASKLAGNVDQLATAWVLFRGDIADSAVAGAVFTRLTDTKIQVTRSTGHGLANGNWITFHALTGFYAFLNGTWEVQNATATTFEFNLAGATTPSAAVTITTANPAVITWTGHALAVGQTVTFSTTGTLPTGITAGTTYFVRTATAGTTFTISLTSGGTAIATTAAGTGTHAATLTGVMTSQIFRPVAINRKYNISKVGRLDLGKYRVFFETKPLTVDYISLGSAADASGDAVGLVGATAQTIDYADIVTTNSAGTNANYNAVRLVVFGG